jgi:hypothetical protein
MLFALVFSGEGANNNVQDWNNDVPINPAGYWSVSPFLIRSDNWTGVPWIQARSGTITDPHVIENVTVDCGWKAVMGIQIDNCNDS